MRCLGRAFDTALNGCTLKYGENENVQMDNRLLLSQKTIYFDNLETPFKNIRISV